MSYVPIREALAAAGEDLKSRFEDGESVVDLVHARSRQVDELLTRLWHEYVPDFGAALVAVGGYGRGELHPGSDVDVLILLPESMPSGGEDSRRETAVRAVGGIGRRRLLFFVRFLWSEFS